ncbi:hypothetical protein SLW70_12050 [Flavobacterium sp. NG2]|uniref:hypothetical protein n=1 Tax=Flavobacterium sp. NG2 TaxID=3097547 RepID=UPI002A7EB7F0|nr:hypothetical protein [Flavobacterium sp. NG2]WPR70664.1 hypothetical protein SLW70_12050 [Flavobacterium sp. NG2]
MKVYNRSAITISYKAPFVDWNNQLTPDFQMDAGMLGESKTYLTKEDFEDANQLIKKYCKTIFELELEGIWTDENDWPQKRDFKTFCEWFHFEVSDWVVDLGNQPLIGDDL